MPVRYQAAAAFAGGEPRCIGVDVSSDQLATAPADANTLDTPMTVVANTDRAILRWLKTLPPGCRIGMGTTGQYHPRPAQLALRAGHVGVVFKPAPNAHYLRALR